MTLAAGFIADDFTGGTDVAVEASRAGLRTVIHFGLPRDDTRFDQPHDAVVLALKSRMLPAEHAVHDSLAALAWLRHRGAERVYFKYCSTFDSTARGNIGPVLDALADALGADTVVMTPSSPAHGRTQYLGKLFVGEHLLAESHMRDHPRTPMLDSDLPRLLRAQTSRSVGLVSLSVVRAEQSDLTTTLGARSERYLLTDAIDQTDLDTIGRAVRDHVLVAGAAGLAGGMARAIHSHSGRAAPEPPDRSGPAAVLAGSCSARTLEQIQRMMAEGRDAYRLDPLDNADPRALAERAVAWYDASPRHEAPLFYSSADPAGLKLVHDRIGVEASAEILESAIGMIAQGLVARGVTRIIAAGGETSGAIVTALGVDGGLIGAEEGFGVPWIHTRDGLALLLKSGNFGDTDLLVRASARKEES
ncbi:MAG: Hrp-dependent type effector protein [Rhodoglobus sp.]|nr:Hrp-dependent type effector protein [Rhodoglobus sp.]